MPEEEQLPLEVKAEALAQTIWRAFEPDELPSGAALEDSASQAIQWLERLCGLFEQQLRAQMEPERLPRCLPEPSSSRKVVTLCPASSAYSSGGLRIGQR